MQKLSINMLKSTILLFILLLKTVYAYDYGSKTFENYGQEDFKSPWANFWKDTGFEEPLNKAADFIVGIITDAKDYDDFAKDWQTLRADYLNPLKVIQFARNTTLPAIVRGCAALQKSWKNLYINVMNFTLNKCDLLLGREATMHPWNAIRQGKETVSSWVFLYAACLSLILFKLCSIWNFIGWLAMGYLTYVTLGPYWCFKWLVFTTGLFWYVFDLVLTYPFHASVAFVLLYLLPYVYSTSTWLGSNATFSFKPNKAVIDEFRMLKGKVNKIEDKTDEIKKKVDELESLFRRMDFNKDN